MKIVVELQQLPICEQSLARPVQAPQRRYSIEFLLEKVESFGLETLHNFAIVARLHDVITTLAVLELCSLRHIHVVSITTRASVRKCSVSCLL